MPKRPAFGQWHTEIHCLGLPIRLPKLAIASRVLSILGRSKQLVQRLVTQRRLTPFEFFGRTYLSVRELKEFQRVERLPGRPWGRKMVAPTNPALSALVDPGQRRREEPRPQANTVS